MRTDLILRKISTRDSRIGPYTDTTFASSADEPIDGVVSKEVLSAFNKILGLRPDFELVELKIIGVVYEKQIT